MFIQLWSSYATIVAGFSLGLDDMEGDLSPPHMGGTSTGGQSSNRGTDGEGHILYGGDPYFE